MTTMAMARHATVDNDDGDGVTRDDDDDVDDGGGATKG